MRLLAVTDAMPQKNWATIAMKIEELGRRRADGAGDQPRRGVDEERVVGVPNAIAAVGVGSFLGAPAIIARFRKNAAIADT